MLGTRVEKIDVLQKAVTGSDGKVYGYEKLLPTGGIPNRLSIPGGDLDGICYFRTLDDYLRMRDETSAGKRALVIGGGFIGSEIAAALTMNEAKVTMVFPASTSSTRSFPRSSDGRCSSITGTKGSQYCRATLRYRSKGRRISM